eukprot:scaffold1440_cov332-Pavlova_lutheri.AAC.56
MAPGVKKDPLISTYCSHAWTGYNAYAGHPFEAIPFHPAIRCKRRNCFLGGTLGQSLELRAYAVPASTAFHGPLMTDKRDYNGVSPRTT